MARKVTIAAFEKWIAEDGNEDLVLDKLKGGMTLRNAAFELKQPYTCLHPYFQSTPERTARYDAAKRSFADGNMDETKDIADNVPATKEDVAKAKLQIEVRQALAKAYYRARWGETLKVEREVKVSADEALLGFAGDLLARLKKPEPKLIESEPLALPDKVER